MGEVLLSLLVIGALLLISLGWKALNWVWLKPNKLEKQLRGQGLKGPSYQLWYGNIKEMVSSANEAKSKPMGLSHRIAPRVMPFIYRAVRKYGKVCFTWFGPIPRLIIMDPDMTREILTNKYGHVTKPKHNPLGRLFATGVAIYEGDKWVKHRRILNPVFYQERLKMMIPAVYTSCSEMLNKWQKLIPDESGELDVWPLLKNLTADVISRTAFGSSYEEGRQIFQLQTEQLELLIQTAQSFYIPGLRFLPTKRNKRMKEIYRKVQTLLRDLILKREKAMATGQAHNNDLLGVLMESNSKQIKDNNNLKNAGMSIDDVIEECKLFYFAGQETTADLLVWTMIVLSMHPHWQEKAREEVLQVFGRNNPDFDGLNHLKIVTMILNEVLRLYPPGTLFTRTTSKELKLGEIILPAGVDLLMPVLLVHHDRDLWGEDAEEFNPSRFSEGIAKAAKNHVSFLPFGEGPRICIGQSFALIEAKMAITMILQQFSFQLSSTYVHAPHTVATLEPQHGAQLILNKL